MVVITVAISILNISVFADDTALGGSENGGGGSGGNRDVVALNEFEIAFADVTQKYVDGDITYTEWNEQQNALLEDFYNKNTSASGDVIAPAYAIGKRFEGFAQKIGETVSTFGDDARQRVADWWNGVTSDVPTETVQTSTTDLMGAGAMMKRIDSSSMTFLNTWDYIVIEPYGDNNVRVHFYTDTVTKAYQVIDGIIQPPSEQDIQYTTLVLDYVGGCFYYEGTKLTTFYGDVRYMDGTQFPTDDEYEISTKKDFDEMSASDLDDLLNDFAEELERQMPDLSTIEGLLKAIYARMGKLDSDNDNGLLSQINSSIQALNASISNFSTGIETSINDLKETITSLFSNGDIKDDDNTETKEHEISGTLYNVIPLEKNWLQKITHNKTNLHVEYQGKEYYLESDGTLLLDGKYYNVDMNYASTLDEILYTLLDIRDSVNLLTEEERQMPFSDYFDLKFNDFKFDFDEKFAFKDNLKTFIENVFNTFESSIPEYVGG